MSVFPTNKTVPLSKDLGVSGAKTRIGTNAREDLETVLTAIDNTLSSIESAGNQGLNNEITNRTNADANLQSQINSEITNRQTADSNEATTRAANDTTEINARTAADTILQNEVDGERAALRATVNGTTGLTVGAAFGVNRIKSDGSNGSTLALLNGALVSDFPGATIDFAAGTITYVGGVPSAGSFTRINFAGQSAKWAKYAIVILPGSPNSVLILAGTSFASTAAAVPNPAVSGGIPVAIVAVQDTGAAGTGTISNLIQTNVIQFAASGSGSGGSGSGSPLDPQPDETFTYYTRSDFGVDSNALELSTTGTDQILGLKKVVLGVGQQFVSKDLTGAQIRADGLVINTVQARLLYNTGKVDLSPTVEFSRDGGNSWSTAQVSLPGSLGNIVEADLSFASPTTALYAGGSTNSTLLSGQKVAAIFTPTYTTTVTGFDMLVRTSATAGSVVGKIMTVATGMPSALLATSRETLAAGQDITPSAQLKTVTFAPITLIAGTSYALVLEGVGLNANLSVDQVTTAPAFSTSSASNNGSGWAASSTFLVFDVYGTGCDLRIRITSGTALSELAGFGVNYVSNTPSGLTGQASYEERTITSTEASTGIITLSTVQYTPGLHQLIAVVANHTYMSPDFIELSPNQVSFGSGFFNAGDLVRFYTAYGIVDGSSLAMTKMSGLFSSIVGSSAQVTAGIANFSSLQAAINAAASGGYILMLQSTITENVTIDRECFIEGRGHSCVLQGTVTMLPAATASMIKKIKFGDNVTIQASANNINITDCWVANGKTISNSGTNNLILAIGE